MDFGDKLGGERREDCFSRVAGGRAAYPAPAACEPRAQPRLACPHNLAAHAHTRTHPVLALSRRPRVAHARARAVSPRPRAPTPDQTGYRRPLDAYADNAWRLQPWPRQRDCGRRQVLCLRGPALPACPMRSLRARG